MLEFITNTSSLETCCLKLIPRSGTSNEPSNPANFRPIALTSCIEKIYTTIIKNCCLSYMKAKKYFNTKLQKHSCFLFLEVQSISQNLHLQSTKSQWVCWLDLANAFGSVHHDLILSALITASLQKAFMPTVPSCTEHHLKLSSILSDAHTNHKYLVVCWLDMENAYGSVHHSLIDFFLWHYHAPFSFLAF